MTIVSFFLSALLCLCCLSITLTQLGALRIVAIVIGTLSLALCVAILIYWIVESIEALCHKRR